MMHLPSHRPEPPHAVLAPRLHPARESAGDAPLLVRALRGEATPRRPVWLMRQAGRYLPGYQRMRAQVTFLELCRHSELAAEVSMEPVERFGVDAAIVFGDILIPLAAMGMPLIFEEAGGPRLTRPLRDVAAIDALSDFDPHKKTPSILATIGRLVAALPSETPVIGFSGAPFTLATYAVEGTLTRDLIHVKALLRREPRALARLIGRLAGSTVPYLAEQARAGARVLQVFDTWAGALTREHWKEFALPGLVAVFQSLRRELGADCPPIVLYSQGTSAWLDLLPLTGADAFGVDWRLPLGDAKARLGGRPIQGNLDPAALLGTPATVRAETRRMLESVKDEDGVVANLGHGVIVGTPPENVEAFVDEVKRS